MNIKLRLLIILFIVVCFFIYLYFYNNLIFKEPFTSTTASTTTINTSAAIDNNCIISVDENGTLSISSSCMPDEDSHDHYLDLQNRQIKDISALSIFNTYRGELKLNLRFNNLTDQDLQILSNFSNIVTLALGYNREIKNIPQLSNFSTLIYLDLSSTQIETTDLQSLSNFNSLRLLDLSSTKTKLTDISNLNNLNTLRDLYLNDNNITTIPDLSAFTNLNLLSLINNDITDLSNILILQNLEFFAIDKNDNLEASEINKLKDLASIHLLNLNKDLIYSISQELKGTLIILALKCNFDNLYDLSDFTSLETILLISIDNTNIPDNFIENIPNTLNQIYLFKPCVSINLQNLQNQLPENINIYEITLSDDDDYLLTGTFSQTYNCEISTNPVETTAAGTTTVNMNPSQTTMASDLISLESCKNLRILNNNGLIQNSENKLRQCQEICTPSNCDLHKIMHSFNIN